MIVKNNYIGLYWSQRAQSSEEYTIFLIDLLQCLSSVFSDNLTVRFKSCKENQLYSVGGFIENIDTIQKLVLDFDINYKTEEDFEGKKSIYSPVGFSSVWEILLDKNPILELSVSSGAYSEYSPASAVVLKFISDINLGFENFKKLWNKLILKSNPIHARYSSFTLDTMVDPNFSFDFSCGWITYIFGDSIEPSCQIKNFEKYHDGHTLYFYDALIGSFDENIIDMLRQCSIRVGYALLTHPTKMPK